VANRNRLNADNSSTEHPRATEAAGWNISNRDICEQMFGPDPVGIPSKVTLNREPRDSPNP
jgi:hypothetical protein